MGQKISTITRFMYITALLTTALSTSVFDADRPNVVFIRVLRLMETVAWKTCSRQI